MYVQLHICAYMHKLEGIKINTVVSFVLDMGIYAEQ